MSKTKTQLHKEIDLINDNRSAYDMVVLSSLLAKYMRRKEEFAGVTVAELIKTAMTDVCTGKISKKQIIKFAEETESRRYHGREFKGKQTHKTSDQKKVSENAQRETGT